MFLPEGISGSGWQIIIGIMKLSRMIGFLWIISMRFLPVRSLICMMQQPGVIKIINPQKHSPVILQPGNHYFYYLCIRLFVRNHFLCNT